MNRGAMITVRTCFFAACLPLILLCTACGSGAPAGDPPLAGASIGGPFELVDKTGKTVRWSDFDGKYRIIYFGYSYCPDICPLDVQRMMLGYARFKQAEPELAAQVQPLFVTVDPARDTPAKVGEFAAAFSADLMGLTGTDAQVDAAAKAFGVFYERGEPVNGGAYLVNHSRSAYLMGRKGEPIALLPVDINSDAVAQELEKWVH